MSEPTFTLREFALPVLYDEIAYGVGDNLTLCAEWQANMRPFRGVGSAASVGHRRWVMRSRIAGRTIMVIETCATRPLQKTTLAFVSAVNELIDQHEAPGGSVFT